MKVKKVLWMGCMGIALTGCALEANTEEATEEGEAIGEAEQAFTSCAALYDKQWNTPGYCSYGPTATFRFTGRVRSYFLKDGSPTERFTQEFVCGNGTTDVCGPMWRGENSPGTWSHHCLESDYAILMNSASCW